MMKSKYLILAAIFLGAGLGNFFLDRGPVADAQAEQVFDGEPEILAATFSSAFCSACKILEPRLKKVIPSFSDQPVRFIEFDFTFGKTADQRQRAQDLGFYHAYERFKNATGFTLLIDAETGVVIDVLTMNHSQDAMRAAIAQSVAVASQSSGKKL